MTNHKLPMESRHALRLFLIHNRDQFEKERSVVFQRLSPKLKALYYVKASKFLDNVTVTVAVTVTVLRLGLEVPRQRNRELSLSNATVTVIVTITC
jgi:hypothetical protein